MEQQKILDALDARAKATGVRMYEICEAVGLAPSTWYRWQKGSEARINTVAALAKEIERREAAMGRLTAQ